MLDALSSSDAYAYIEARLRCFFSCSSLVLLIRAVSTVLVLYRDLLAFSSYCYHTRLSSLHTLLVSASASRSLQYSRTLISSIYLLLCSSSADIQSRHPWLPPAGRSLYSNSPCSLYIPRANLHIRLYYTTSIASTTVSKIRHDTTYRSHLTVNHTTPRDQISNRTRLKTTS